MILIGNVAFFIPSPFVSQLPLNTLQNYQKVDSG